MLRIALRGLTLLGVGVLVLAGTAVAAEAAPQSTTFVSMVSESGEWVGGGDARLWRTDSGSVAVSGSVSDTVSVNVSGGASGDDFTLTFAAAPGDTLVTGTYTDAQRTPFRTAGHPGIDIYGSGRGCNTDTGTFTVLDVAADLSRLWLTYEQHCEGGVPALFGEVRYNEPNGDSDLLVAPDHVTWPAQYPTVPGSTVPVTLVNTGAATRTISAATITSGATDFAVTGNTCSTVQVGSSCVVSVRFTPSTDGPRTGTLTILDSTPAGTHTVTLNGTGITGHSSWDMLSQSGDYIGAGDTWSYTPKSATISAAGSSSVVSVSVNANNGDNWTAEFEADPNSQLTPGTTYSGATRYPFNSTQPGLSVTGLGRGCNTLTGSFTIHEIAFDAGTLSKLSVSFEQHCEGVLPALFGSIAWRADNPAAPLPRDTFPPPAVTDVGAYPMIGSLILGWSDPSVNDWASTMVRVTTGLVAPATPTSGVKLYDGRDGGTLLDGLAPGTDYSFSVFPRDTWGNVGPATKFTVRGSALSARVAPSTTTFGQATTLSGQLVDSHSGAAIGGQRVALYARKAGARSWQFVTSRVTASDGRYSVTTRLSGNTDFEVYFYGSGRHLGVTAGPVRASVAPRITISVNHTWAHLGARFTISTAVAPNRSGQTVALQRYRGGRWHTVSTAKLSSTSRATFAVKPASKGAFTYRVWKAAEATHVAAVSRHITLHAT